MPSQPPPPESLFHFLTTDSQSVGIVGWISFFVTVSGFAITLWQLKKTKNAAQASIKATETISKNVKTRERLIELGNVVSHLNSAISALTQAKIDASAIYVELAITSIFQVNELLVDFPEQRSEVRKVIFRIKVIGEALSNPHQEIPPDHLALAFEARQIATEVKSIAASVRYIYDQEVVS